MQIKAGAGPLADSCAMASATLSFSPPAPMARWRDVILPKEHGSWSLALEPIALGLLVAPSWAGGSLAVAVLAGFLRGAR
jgi:hypothetical protein